MYIRIINTPSGEAPEQVRAAWVGIVLPLAIFGVRDVATIGVLSLPKTWLGSLYAYLSGGMKRAQGYTVKADRAIEILATHSPAAANWWRENAAAAIRPGMYFLFPTESCQQVEQWMYQHIAKYLTVILLATSWDISSNSYGDGISV
jgi:hypothetical protein